MQNRYRTMIQLVCDVRICIEMFSVFGCSNQQQQQQQLYALIFHWICKAINCQRQPECRVRMVCHERRVAIK